MIAALQEERGKVDAWAAHPGLIQGRQSLPVPHDLCSTLGQWEGCNVRKAGSWQCSELSQCSQRGCCLRGVLPPYDPNVDGCMAADGEGLGKRDVLAQPVPYLSQSLSQSTTKGFLLSWDKITACWRLWLFSPKQQKQRGYPPDEPCVSGLTADDATQRDPAPPQCGVSMLASPKRYLYRKLVTIANGYDSWGS